MKRTEQSPSLTWSVFVRLVPVILGLIGLLGLSNYYAARRQILAGVEREIQILTAQAAARLEAFFEARREDALALAQLPLLRDHLANLDYGLKQEAEEYRQELTLHLSEFSKKVGVYRTAAFVDPQGRERAVGSPEGPLKPSTMPPSAVLGTLPPGQARDSGIPPGYPQTILYSAGVWDGQSKFRGNIVLICELDHVRTLLDTLRVGTHGQTLLVDAAGESLLGRSLPLTHRIFREAEIPGTPWRVRLLAKPDEFLGPLRHVQQSIAVLSLLAGLAALLWTQLKIRKTTRPIEKMAEGTQKIAAGELDYRFETPAIRELKTLAEAFNDMASHLKQRDTDLQARIRELSALREMDDAVMKRSDEESILRTCLEAVAKGLSLDRTGVYWIDTRSGCLVGRCAYGTQGTPLFEPSFRSRKILLGGDDILNQAVRMQEAILVKDPGGDPRVNPFYVQESDTREFVAAPISGKDRVLGVLVADNYFSKRPLQEPDREGLTLFANAVGLAVENATLLKHLAESEGRYRAVLDNSPVAVLGLSQSHHITTWNRGAEQIFGYVPGEIVGKPLGALFPLGSEEEMSRLVSRMIEKGSVRDHPMPGLAKGDRRLDLSLSWGGAHTDYWMNREWTAVLYDATEAKKLQQQLIRSEKLSAVGKLISGIAHELNNPLQAVVGYAQLLEDFREEGGSGGRRSKEVQADLRQILHNAIQCRKIIDNLLLFVRHGEVEKRPVRIEEVLRRCLDLLGYKLTKASNVRVVLKLPRRLPKVQADSQQIQQVFLNLINNACDAMAGSKPPHELHIRAAALDGRVAVEVTDTGPGIPEEHRGRIFEPFFTTKPEGRGTGLGLAICRQILEDHGGQLRFLGLPGQGATFRLELPTAAEREAPARKKAPPMPRVPGRRVLVVDDEPSVQAFLCQVLEEDKDLADTAFSLEEAFSRISRKPYDLVVADIRLGDGTGLDLYERWPGHSRYPRPPFLFLTGDIVSAELHRDIERRSLPLLYKPVDLKAFRRSVRGILSGKSLGV